MGPILVRLRCESCGRTKVLKGYAGSDDDSDLFEAEPGEAVERECQRCDRITDHVVLAEAKAGA